MPTKSARDFWTGGWYRTADSWLLVAALVLPLGWMLPLCRFVWVRAISRREAGAGRSES